MLAILIALGAGAGGGVVAGSLAAWWTTHRQSASPMAVDDLPRDPELDEQISKAARGWAMRQGQPTAAPLVADKLRLLLAMNQRRSRRRRWKR
jgi:hypothetical protein